MFTIDYDTHTLYVYVYVTTQLNGNIECLRYFLRFMAKIKLAGTFLFLFEVKKTLKIVRLHLFDKRQHTARSVME